MSSEEKRRAHRHHAGDGINDSPALSAAASHCHQRRAAIAREIADVTIAADSLRELVILKSIANGLQKRTKSNYRFIMSFNSTLIVLGAWASCPRPRPRFCIMRPRWVSA